MSQLIKPKFKSKIIFSKKLANFHNFLNFALIIFLIAYIVLFAVLLGVYGIPKEQKTNQKQSNNLYKGQEIIYVIYAVAGLFVLVLWIKMGLVWISLSNKNPQKYQVDVSSLSFVKKIYLFLFSFSGSKFEQFCLKNKLEFHFISESQKSNNK
ncbi:hypothetical protein NPA08_00765 [Mycoplasmopsis citelli]|uniref:Transmembrane protein n=1 Tax=Mycoplasmopsis citelli TaxID=171281 RepID=A0A449B388_9BACT|nr:hypothetical protein [Mycoplasmopsis citelli]UUD36356.1 hypothetical protein NPA08_00765 [Mycoplasmopsis citelli]VEU75060.1 Uncharacterised protein [Mycoplasmopsis citelli]